MPWSRKHHVNYKAMAFQHSCFPCCIQIALNNMGLISKNDELEERWNAKQINVYGKGKGLDHRPPHEDDVFNSLPELLLDFPLSHTLITPDMLAYGDDPNVAAAASQLAADFTSGKYCALIFGIAHATIVYRQSPENYVWLLMNPPPLANIGIEQCSEVRIGVALDRDTGEGAILVTSPLDKYFRVAGEFVLAIGR